MIARAGRSPGVAVLLGLEVGSTVGSGVEVTGAAVTVAVPVGDTVAVGVAEGSPSQAAKRVESRQAAIRIATGRIRRCMGGVLPRKRGARVRMIV